MTAGDSFWQGMRDYNQSRPCPNGLPIDMRLPGECEHWRRRIEKAKRDIETWNRDIAIQQRSESITDDEFDIWFNTLTKGRNEYSYNNS
jgi:hypothetical protein